MYQIWQLVVSRPFFPSLSECPPLRSMVLYRYDTLIIPHVTNIVLHVVSVGLMDTAGADTAGAAGGSPYMVALAKFNTPASPSTPL